MRKTPNKDKIAAYYPLITASLKLYLAAGINIVFCLEGCVFDILLLQHNYLTHFVKK